MHDSDAQLLDAWCSGDAAAGERLFERHYAAIVRFFRNKVTSEYDDLVQQTFVACVEQRERFQSASSFRSYIFGIARHVLFHHFRRRQRKEGRIDFTEISAIDLAPGPSTLFAKHREQELLMQALRMIPVESQILLELYYWEDLSASAVGEVLELPEPTVRNRLRSSKRKLLEKLSELCCSDSMRTPSIEDLEDWIRSSPSL